MIQDEQAKRYPAATIRDPICGTELEPRQVFATRTVGGEIVAFCSQRCVQQFDHDHTRSATTGVAENGHLCRMERSVTDLDERQGARRLEEQLEALSGVR